MKETARAKQRERCRANRQKNKVELREYKKLNRVRIRERVAKIKESQSCMDCGFYYPACIMEYDHRPGTVKLNTVARLVAGEAKWSRILDEMAKCDLVCANCHRYRTYVTRKEVLNPTQKAP